MSIMSGGAVAAAGVFYTDPSTVARAVLSGALAPAAVNP
jgi:hypothetical protein